MMSVTNWRHVFESPRSPMPHSKSIAMHGGDKPMPSTVNWTGINAEPVPNFFIEFENRLTSRS